MKNKQTQFMISILIFLLYTLNAFAEEGTSLECNTTSNFINTLQGKSKSKKLKNIHQETKTLMIMVDFKTKKYKKTEKYLSDNIYNLENKESLHSFWYKIRYGAQSIKPAEESWNIKNDGVVRVTLPYDVDQGFDQDGSMFTGTANSEALNKASEYIDFSKFDTNNDGIVDKTELIIVFTYPINFRAYASGISKDYDDITLKTSSIVIGSNTNIDLLLHEAGHALYHLPDLYTNYVAYGNTKVSGLMNKNDSFLSGYSSYLIGARVGTENNDEMRLIERDAPSDVEGPRVYRIDTEDPEEYFLLENIKGYLNIIQVSTHMYKQCFLPKKLNNTSYLNFKYVSGTSTNISVKDVLSTGNVMTFSIDRKAHTLQPAEMINPLNSDSRGVVGYKKLSHFRWTDVGADKYGLEVLFSLEDGEEIIVYKNMDIKDNFVKFDPNSLHKYSNKSLTVKVTLSTFINNKWEKNIYYYHKIPKFSLEAPTDVTVRLADDRDDCSLALTWNDNAENEIGYFIRHNETVVDTIPANSESYTLSLPIDKKKSICNSINVGISAFGLKGMVSRNVHREKNSYSPLEPEKKSLIISPKNWTKVNSGDDIALRWKNYGAARVSLLVTYDIPGKPGSTTIIKNTNIFKTNTTFKIPSSFIVCTIKLKSYDENNNSLGSSVIYIHEKIPAAPRNLRVEGTGETTATLKWEDNSNNERGFLIHEDTLGLIAKLDANTESYKLVGLSPKKRYRYRVKAYGASGPSGEATAYMFTPSKIRSIITAPTDGTKIKGGENVTFTWESYGVTSLSFSVYYYLNGEKIYITNGFLDPIITSKKVKIPPNIKGKVYARLFSYLGHISKGGSTTILKIDETLPNNPTDLGVMNITKNSATLTWTANDTNIIGYNIYENTTLKETLDANVTTYTATELTADTNYTYSVKAYNASGESSASSTSFKTDKDTAVVATKSLITSPKNRDKIVPGSNVTVTWENHGATRKNLTVGARVNGEYIYIKKGRNIQGTSATFKMPLGFTIAFVYLFSYNKDYTYLGNSMISLSPEK